MSTTPQNDNPNAPNQRRRRSSAPLHPPTTKSPTPNPTPNPNPNPNPPHPSYFFPSNVLADNGDPRDLAALLSYGPAGIPYTAAWTDSRIEQVRAYKHWTYIAIRAIAATIASTIPNVTYVTSAATTAAKHSQHPRQKALLPLLAHEQLEPVDADHPLLRLLLDPNEPDTAYDLLYETCLFHCLTGSAYWWCPKNEVTGLPDALWVLPSHWVWPVYGTHASQNHLAGWELRPVEGNYLRRFLPADEVVVFRDKNPISKIDGYSPLTAGANWVDTLTMINSARFHSYRNGTFPTVSVEFDGTYNDPSEEDLRRIESKFLQRYVGDHKSNKPLFLPPGVKAKPLTLKPAEMVFGDSAQETRDNILALFGVPPIIAGLMEGVSTEALTAAQIAFFQVAVNPRQRYYGQAITENLARLYAPDLRVWWEDGTPADPHVQEEQIKTDLLAGAVTPNELRLLRGRQPYPATGWGDHAIIPVNMAVAPVDAPFPTTAAQPPADKPVLPTGGDSTDLLDDDAPTQPGYSSKE